MIHVLIEREIAPDMQSTYEEAARKILASAYRTTGFVEGQTYIEKGNPLRRFTLSKWQSELHWQRWYSSEERREQMSQLRPLLLEREKITILQAAE
ncbi:Quinol monooxygenase YgiN [Microbulbifer thermotolerans]|uniref:antibiotic biosynthesis monooxygenase family protein n=1 Tax=Microbulbifer thermotolerans TaxID=252514 RepID=UPI0008E91E62|nr:antibiotic biosynthesis monooxygenase [Microbulbifer thermotolerans]MCX2833861.1 antibiotic biosynthesis monooxygenase [Microbulbifer thermotolerans]SFB95844.1 Quinol monooxygenase YgiN [Microbulbifer thermotolerans]